MNIVVLGAGNVSSHFMKFCEQEKIKVALIDKDKQALDIFKNKKFIQTFHEDFHNSTILNYQFFKNTDLFFSVTGSDETNLLACKTVSKFGVSHIVCRNKYIELQKAQDTLVTEIGNYRIVNPSKLLAREIARNIETPNSIEQFLLFDNILIMIGFKILPYCKILNLILETISKKIKKIEAVLVGIQRKGIFYTFNETFLLQEGDIAYFLCVKKKIKQLRKILGYHRNEKHNIIIAGGGIDGYNLALTLCQSNYNFKIKIIEQNLERCNYLAEKLNNIAIINLNLLDIQELIDEGVEYVNTFVAISDNTPNNLLSSFLVSSYQIKHLICSVEYASYLDILNNFPNYNINGVCAHLLTANFLSYLLYSKKILKYYKIQNSNMEVLELIVDYPKLQGFFFKELKFNENVILLAYYRAKKISFNIKDYRFNLGDNILLILQKKNRNSVINKLKPK